MAKAAKLVDPTKVKSKKTTTSSTPKRSHKKKTPIATKSLVLEEGKGTKNFRSGPEIRNLLGIPANEDVKVDPGNLGDRKLFIQSTSATGNRQPRKLVRGTTVLYKK